MMAILANASSAAKIGLILSGLSFILDIVGFATPFWLYNSGAGGKTYQGLWQLCISILGRESDCQNWSGKYIFI